MLNIFYALKISEQEKLSACEIPPSVILFIHAARAICFVSGWKLCWDHGLIALFAELIVLFDLPFSQGCLWEQDDLWSSEVEGGFLFLSE